MEWHAIEVLPLTDIKQATITGRDVSRTAAVRPALVVQVVLEAREVWGLWASRGAIIDDYGGRAVSKQTRDLSAGQGPAVLLTAWVDGGHDGDHIGARGTWISGLVVQLTRVWRQCRTGSARGSTKDASRGLTEEIPLSVDARILEQGTEGVDGAHKVAANTVGAARHGQARGTEATHVGGEVHGYVNAQLTHWVAGCFRTVDLIIFAVYAETIVAALKE